VITAVEDGGFEVDDGVAGEVAADGSLEDAFLDGGDEVAGDGAAEDLVDELEAGAAREGFEADFAVAELAVAAALFLVTAVACRRCANRLAVGDLGGFERDFGVEAAAEFGGSRWSGDRGRSGAGDLLP
jgi:hypothetical protein